MGFLQFLSFARLNVSITVQLYRYSSESQQQPPAAVKNHLPFLYWTNCTCLSVADTEHAQTLHLAFVFLFSLQLRLL